MRGMKRPATKPRRTIKTTPPGMQKLAARRAVNRNAHVITPHGTLQAGRKGRKG